MAFPTTSILDPFNRANEGPPPSANWTTGIGGTGGGIKVVSNQAAMNDGTQSSAYWSAATFGPDCEVFVTVAAAATGVNDRTYLFARMQETGTTGADGYYFRGSKAAGADTWIIARVDNNTATQLGVAVDQEIGNGDAAGFELIGSTLKGYYKVAAGSWTEILSRTDSTYNLAGNIGLQGNDASLGWIWDDFGGGTIAAGLTQISLSASFGGSANYLRMMGFLLPAATMNMPTGLSRGMFFSLAPSFNVTAAVGSGLFRIRALAASLTESASLSVLAHRLRTLSASYTAPASLSRLADRFRTLAASEQMTGAMHRGLYRTLAATMDMSASLTAVAVVIYVLSVSATFNGSAALARTTHRVLTLAANSNVSASLSKLSSKVLNAAMDMGAAIARSGYRLLSLPASFDASAALTKLADRFKALSAFVQLSATLTRGVVKGISLSVAYGLSSTLSLVKTAAPVVVQAVLSMLSSTMDFLGSRASKQDNISRRTSDDDPLNSKPGKGGFRR